MYSIYLAHILSDLKGLFMCRICHLIGEGSYIFK